MDYCIPDVKLERDVAASNRSSCIFSTGMTATLSLTQGIQPLLLLSSVIICDLKKAFSFYFELYV